MKIKIEKTIDIDEAPGEAKRSLSMAVDHAISVHKLMESLSKEADNEVINANSLNDNIHKIRECLFEMDLTLSDASAILINYQAATAQEAASRKQLSENEE